MFNFPGSLVICLCCKLPTQVIEGFYSFTWQCNTVYTYIYVANLIHVLQVHNNLQILYNYCLRPCTHIFKSNLEMKLHHLNIIPKIPQRQIFISKNKIKQTSFPCHFLHTKKPTLFPTTVTTFAAAVGHLQLATPRCHV